MEKFAEVAKDRRATGDNAPLHKVNGRSATVAANNPTEQWAHINHRTASPHRFLHLFLSTLALFSPHLSTFLPSLLRLFPFFCVFFSLFLEKWWIRSPPPLHGWYCKARAERCFPALSVRVYSSWCIWHRLSQNIRDVKTLLLKAKEAQKPDGHARNISKLELCAFENGALLKHELNCHHPFLQRMCSLTHFFL